jgi:hypothetical protein
MKLRLLIASFVLFPFLSSAAEAEFALIIKDHRFVPTDLKVPAGQKFKLVVHNQDATPEEFESHDLNREKVIAPNSKAGIFIGPLKPGKYSFVGEFNQATAKGVLIAE